MSDHQEKREHNEIVAFIKTYIGRKPDDFAPPFTRWLDGEMVSVCEGEIVMKFVVREEMTNPTGLLHGGMHAAMMDDIIGMTVLTLVEKGVALTVDLHVDYLGRVEKGDVVYAYCRVERNGRKIINAMCELRDKNGTTISKGSSNLVKTGYAKPFSEDETGK